MKLCALFLTCIMTDLPGFPLFRDFSIQGLLKDFYDLSATTSGCGRASKVLVVEPQPKLNFVRSEYQYASLYLVNAFLDKKISRT